MKFKVDVSESGTIYRISDDKFHRLDGPSVEWIDGTKSWYRNGRAHRDDGPAIDRSGNDAGYPSTWYIDGIELTKEQVALKKREISLKERNAK